MSAMQPRPSKRRWRVPMAIDEWDELRDVIVEADTALEAAEMACEREPNAVVVAPAEEITDA